LLFLIYVNDLPLVSKCNTKLFADDTVLSLSNECFQQLKDNVNSEMSKIDCWMRINKLSINYNKTKYMVISNKRQTCKGQVKIGKHEIEQVAQITYLGVIFDNKLTWKPHMQHVCNKLSSGAWALLKPRNYVDINTLKTVYYSIIYSHLQYCISSWGNGFSTVPETIGNNTQKDC